MLTEGVNIQLVAFSFEHQVACIKHGRGSLSEQKGR